jgi:hypothetical protein
VSAVDRRRGGGRAAPGRSGRAPLDRFHRHLDPLWILAQLSFEDGKAAERAVVDAVSCAAADPTMARAGPPEVWANLAQHVGNAVDGNDSQPKTEASMTRQQREALALLAAGRTARQTAALLDVTTAQVQRDVRAGLHALWPAASPGG